MARLVKILLILIAAFVEAPELYFKVSPFMHADKVNEPILLTHGEADTVPTPRVSHSSRAPWPGWWAAAWSRS